jgi:hypothetical protein
VVATPCQFQVNTNASGTVNPYVFPARNGLFYVTYVASEDQGGNMKLAWVDPVACTTVKGPFTVNSTPGGVYYWGAQWARSDDAGNFYAVWEDTDAGFVPTFAYSESGDVFGPSAGVLSTSENGTYPTLAVVEPGHALVAWTGLNGSQYDIFLTANTNVFGGGAWAPAVQVNNTKMQDDSTAVVTDTLGNVYVGWESFQDGSPEGGNVYVARSTDGGKTFGAAVKVNDVASKANVGIGTFLAWGGGRLYVVWSDTRTDWEGDIYLDSSADGVTFGNDVLVNDNTYRYQEDPSVVVGQGGACSGHVYIVWQDLRSNKDYDIYGTYSADNGQTFLANQAATLETDDDQMNPAISVDASCMIGVTWREAVTNPSFDIYAAFYPTW